MRKTEKGVGVVKKEREWLQYFSRVLTWITAVKLQKFHQLREEQILSDMSVKRAYSVTRASEEGRMKNNELKTQCPSSF